MADLHLEGPDRARLQQRLDPFGHILGDETGTAPGLAVARLAAFKLQTDAAAPLGPCSRVARHASGVDSSDRAGPRINRTDDTVAKR